MIHLPAAKVNLYECPAFRFTASPLNLIGLPASVICEITCPGSLAEMF